MGPREPEEAEPAELDEPAPAQFPHFLLALFDETNVRILRAASQAWVSVKEIAEAADVPSRACYGRVNYLYENGLLRLRERNAPRRGRPTRLYRSSLGNVNVVLSGGEYSVSLVWPEIRFDLSVQFKED